MAELYISIERIVKRHELRRVTDYLMFIPCILFSLCNGNIHLSINLHYWTWSNSMKLPSPMLAACSFFPSVSLVSPLRLNHCNGIVSVASKLVSRNSVWPTTGFVCTSTSHLKVISPHVETPNFRQPQYLLQCGGLMHWLAYYPLNCCLLTPLFSNLMALSSNHIAWFSYFLYAMLHSYHNRSNIVTNITSTYSVCYFTAK